MHAEKSSLDVGEFLMESVAQLFYNPNSLPALKAGENLTRKMREMLKRLWNKNLANGK
jgi:hypothetical protein